jgi:hypothetical protein
MDYSYDYGTTSSYDSGAGDMAGLLAGGVGIGMMIVWLIIVLVIAVVGIYLTYRLVKKMGYAWWMVLLVMFFQPIMIIYFAFAKWPVEAKVEQLEGGKKE